MWHSVSTSVEFATQKAAHTRRFSTIAWNGPSCAYCAVPVANSVVDELAVVYPGVPAERRRIPSARERAIRVPFVACRRWETPRNQVYIVNLTPW